MFRAALLTVDPTNRDKNMTSLLDMTHW